MKREIDPVIMVKFRELTRDDWRGLPDEVVAKSIQYQGFELNEHVRTLGGALRDTIESTWLYRKLIRLRKTQ